MKQPKLKPSEIFSTPLHDFSDPTKWSQIKDALRTKIATLRKARNLASIEEEKLERQKKEKKKKSKKSPLDQPLEAPDATDE